MFAARGIVVAVSVFVIVYCALSLAVVCTWRKVWLGKRKQSARRAANLLFTLRMFPLMAAAMITAAFTIPSFVLLEPRAIHEPLGGMPLALALCGAALGIFGAVNAASALRKASRSISAWTAAARPADAWPCHARGGEACAPVPVLRISPPLPAMTAVGIVRPRILLSDAAESLLTAGELQTALNHELAHLRRGDNLKKLLLRFVAFPGLGSLEAAWLRAIELTADDEAVSNPAQALDLASALIKLSRLGMVEPPVDLTAALVHGPASFMSTRIERLIAWSEEHRGPSRRLSLWCGLAAGLATVAVFAFTYSHLLAQVHTATEWLVR
ncbi:MAG TPA: M56 family metallopeptidase [Terriglobales bacterium]|nr:M56 family metallopeptidase [Terriglobales bacterium]